MCCRATGNGEQAAGALWPPLMDECERKSCLGMAVVTSVAAIAMLAVGIYYMHGGHRIPGSTLPMHQIVRSFLVGAGLEAVIAVVCGGALMFDCGQRNALESRRTEED